ncbi:MAG TPA: hypothetical protein VI072_11570 [Polyangiaceae bacterium]
MHPARFPNGPPKAALPPAEVHINPLEALAVSVAVDAQPIDDTLPASRSQMACRAMASTRDSPVRTRRQRAGTGQRPQNDAAGAHSEVPPAA